MKRGFLFVLFLFIIFSMSACTLIDRIMGTVSEHENEDFQKGIPEKYRLKINVPDYLNDPLPATDKNFDSILFGVWGTINGEQSITTEPSNLPKVIDLFSIEELEAYFDMTVVVNEEKSPYRQENQDAEEYLLYKKGTEPGSFSDGNVHISITDWGDPQSASYYMTSVFSNKREIEDLGISAIMLTSSSNTVYIQVTDTAVLGVSVEIKPPEGGFPEPLEDEAMLDFARMVYNRFMEKNR